MFFRSHIVAVLLPLSVRGFSPSVVRKIPFVIDTAVKQTSMKPSTRLFASGGDASIVDQVTAEMKVAMKAKEQVKLNTIRLIRTAFANAAIELKTDKLSDDQAQTVLRKLAKMRQESIQMFADGGAQDRADAERAELAVIETWMATLADEDQTRAWVREAIEEVGSTDNIGRVMGSLMKKHKNDLDGAMAKRIVEEECKK